MKPPQPLHKYYNVCILSPNTEAPVHVRYYYKVATHVQPIMHDFEFTQACANPGLDREPKPSCIGNACSMIATRFFAL